MSNNSHLLTRMLVRERWMLCLTWLLGWEGLEEGALGAGGTSRFLVSFSSVGADGGFWHDAEAETWLDDGCGPDCFFGMTYVVLVTIRAPVSWCLEAEVVGDCVTGGVDFAEVGGIEGFDSTGFCFDTPLLIDSFTFSWEWLCGGAGSLTGWEEGAAPVEGSSGDCFGGATVSLSAFTCSLSSLAVRKKNSMTFCQYKKI